jgi:hypothetical protein
MNPRLNAKVLQFISQTRNRNRSFLKMNEKVNILIVSDSEDFFSKQISTSLASQIGNNYAVQTVVFRITTFNQQDFVQTIH